MKNSKLLKFILKELNFYVRTFIYKSFVVFILAIIFYKLTIGNKINLIHEIIKKIDIQINKIDILANNSENLKKKLKESLKVRLNREYFFNDTELLELIVKSKIKIDNEIKAIEKKQ